MWFSHNNIIYEIDHGHSDYITIFITEFDNNNNKIVKSENYSSLIELFDKFRIDNKTIKELWQDISY